MKYIYNSKIIVNSPAKTLLLIGICFSLLSVMTGCKNSDTQPTSSNKVPSTAIESPVSDFPYTDNGDNTVSITEYKGSGGAVIIPSKINGKPVVSIGISAFSLSAAYKEITSVVIPNSVTTIESDAFSGCIGLTTITIPASVTKSAGSRTFENCSNLHSVYFEGGAPEIWGANQFRGTVPNFTTYHHASTSGWGNPWQGYPSKTY